MALPPLAIRLRPRSVAGKCQKRDTGLGSEQFNEQMLELMEGKLGESHSGEFHRETAEQRANRIIAEELARRGWQESELATRRRSDPGKLASAGRLRSETTLPIKWIAARVQIGTAKGAKSVLPHLAQRSNAKPQKPSNHACTSLTGAGGGNTFPCMTVAAKGAVVLPQKVLKQHRVRAGDKFEITAAPDEPGVIELRRVGRNPNEGLVELLRSCPVKGFHMPKRSMAWVRP